MLAVRTVGVLMVFTENMLNAHKTNDKDVYKIPQRNPEERDPLQKPWRKREDNVKLDLKQRVKLWNASAYLWIKLWTAFAYLWIKLWTASAYL
jgi:hypothetical protein